MFSFVNLCYLFWKVRNVNENPIGGKIRSLSNIPWWKRFQNYLNEHLEFYYFLNILEVFSLGRFWWNFHDTLLELSELLKNWKFGSFSSLNNFTGASPQGFLLKISAYSHTEFQVIVHVHHQIDESPQQILRIDNRLIFKNLFQEFTSITLSVIIWQKI